MFVRFAMQVDLTFSINIDFHRFHFKGGMSTYCIPSKLLHLSNELRTSTNNVCIGSAHTPHHAHVASTSGNSLVELLLNINLWFGLILCCLMTPGLSKDIRCHV